MIRVPRTLGDVAEEILGDGGVEGAGRVDGGREGVRGGERHALLGRARGEGRRGGDGPCRIEIRDE